MTLKLKFFMHALLVFCLPKQPDHAHSSPPAYCRTVRLNWPGTVLSVRLPVSLAVVCLVKLVSDLMYATQGFFYVQKKNKTNFHFVSAMRPERFFSHTSCIILRNFIILYIRFLTNEFENFSKMLF